MIQNRQVCFHRSRGCNVAGVHEVRVGPKMHVGARSADGVIGKCLLPSIGEGMHIVLLHVVHLVPWRCHMAIRARVRRRRRLQGSHLIHLVAELERVQLVLLLLVTPIHHLLRRPQRGIVAKIRLWHLHGVQLRHTVIKMPRYWMAMRLVFGAVKGGEEVLHLLIVLLTKQRLTRWRWLVQI